MMVNAISIVLAGAMIAAAILVALRWDFAAFGGQTYLLDRWSGQIVGCNATNDKRLAASELGVGIPYRCKSITQEEFKRGGIN